MVKTPKCPQCDSIEGIEQIVYGLPSPDLMKAAGRNEVSLGGLLSVNTTVAVVNVGIDGGTFGKTERWRKRKNHQEMRDSLIE